MLIGVVSAAPVVLIVALILRHRKRDREAAEKLYQLKAKELENETARINENKIVSCQYCGKQSRYKDGVCRFCGGDLEYK